MNKEEMSSIKESKQSMTQVAETCVEYWVACGIHRVSIHVCIPIFGYIFRIFIYNALTNNARKKVYENTKTKSIS